MRSSDGRRCPARPWGFVDHERRLIALSAALEPNAHFAVLVHELAHVHGGRYEELGRAGAEVVAETAAFVALSTTGLDTAGQSAPMRRAGRTPHQRTSPPTPRPSIESRGSLERDVTIGPLHSVRELGVVGRDASTSTARDTRAPIEVAGHGRA